MSDGAWLGELLAVIHGDGGHYQSEHGAEEATKDAIKLHHQMIRQIDELETALAAEREQGVKALAERSFELHECQKQLAAERDKHP